MATPRIQNGRQPDDPAQATSGSLPAGSRETAIVIDHPLRSRLASPAPAVEPPPMNEVQATAEYIAQLSSELARLAEGQKLTILSYFLDMAAVEANAVASPGARG